MVSKLKFHAMIRLTCISFYIWCLIDHWAGARNCKGDTESDWARQSDFAFPDDGPFHPEGLHWVHGVLLRFKLSELICLIEFLNLLALNALESIATYPNGILHQSCDKDPSNDYVYCTGQSISSFSCSQKETRNDKNVFVGIWIKAKGWDEQISIQISVAI